MKNILFLLIVFFSARSIAYSQNDSILKNVIGFNVESSFRYYNFNSLNQDLRNAGFNEIEEFRGISLGVSDRYTDKNTYATAIITWIRSIDIGNAPKKASINILEFSTEMHWVLSKSPKWFIYPYLGFGSGISMVNLSDKINNTFISSIQDLSIQDRNVKRYFSNPLLFIDFGAGLDRKIHILNNNYYLGLSLGYRLSSNSKWSINDSPVVRYSGFDINARIRFEYIKKTRSKYYKPKYYKYVY